MNATPAAYVLMVVVPLLAVWLIAVVDVVRQPHLSTRVRWLWVVSFSLAWPLLVVYLLTRPVQGRFERAESREYPHARLVDAALAHEDGRIDDDGMAALARELRAG